MDLKCVVIDDEQYAINAMVDYIERMPGLSVYKTYNRPTAALIDIQFEDEIDIIFLDIEMPELSGLELAKSIRDKARALIFTTSHTKHALEAFQLNANQYMLKPITFAKFAFTIDYLLKNTTLLLPRRRNDQQVAQPQSKLQFIKADQRNAYHYIDPTEITHIQASRNYVVIHTSKEKYLTHMGLNHIESALSKNDFIRVGKSYIIAKSAIRKIEGHNIKLKNNQSFQLGEVYKAGFVEFMKNHMLRSDLGDNFQLNSDR